METLQDLIRVRREKLEALKQAGIDPYPCKYERTHTVERMLAEFDDLQKEGAEISLAGRLVAKRVMGKASFAHLLDNTGRIQLYFRRDDLGEQSYGLFKQAADLGDWIGVSGKVMVTKTGEKTLHANGWTTLAKCIRPLPVVKEDAETGRRYHEFTDPDERYRNRALDLFVNPEEREVFQIRAKLITIMRRFLDERGFLETETPVLQPLYGGGIARPFVTEHKQLKKRLYLRIADELYLKRLIVGGLDRVYEISKDFRNEGVDRIHNPEFTMMECYVAFKDYNYHLELVEQLVSLIAREIHGSCRMPFGDGELDFTPPWPRIRYIDALREETGEDLLDADLAKVKKVAKKMRIELPENVRWAKAIDAIFNEVVEPKFTQPTFVIDYPIQLSPLARRHPDDQRLVERFEAFAGGMEIANAFSEISDPEDQRARFEEQAKARAEGDEEAMVLDEDFIAALELGMPPTAGLGMGIDRLAMLIADRTSIRDVILFPLLRDRQ